HLLFFALLLTPPTSTLFPYTTLFRSRLLLGAIEELHQMQHLGINPRLPYRRLILHLAARVRRYDELRLRLAELVRLARAQGRRQDRKSTRLNSSHLGISYAVFCLKKK